AAAAAAAALPLILGVDAVGALSQVLNDETRALPVRLAALRESDDVAALIPALTNGERQIRMTALSILGRLAASEKWPNVASAALLAALSGELASPPESTDSTEPDTKEEQTDSAEPEDAKEMDSYPTSSWQAIMAASGANDARAELGDTNENGIRLTQADMEYLALSKQTPRKGRAKLTRAVPLHLDLPWAAAKILGDVQERDAALALTVKLEAALSSDDKPMRQAATDSLARIGEKLGGLPAETFPVLARAAADGDQVCRHLAVRALGFSGNDQARDIFVGLLRDKDSLIRAEAITALACVGAAGSSFEDHLGDQERSVRLAAADALAKQRGTGAFDLLIEYTFAGEGRDRRPAARLLRQIDRQAASASFVHVLQDASRLRERIIAIEALEELYMT
ncbi:MAG: HEAT repeat domain-containing protein, partial [Rhodospirillaceae bacterium]|nr:HEAT repeat domain-containing protein [Rhodospirillaceae bacterium]